MTSQYYFAHLFRQSMGIAPYKYVIQQRIAQAKRLLRRYPQMAISEIALECGFANQRGLDKHFRNATGMPPNGYRRGTRVTYHSP